MRCCFLLCAAKVRTTNSQLLLADSDGDSFWEIWYSLLVKNVGRRRWTMVYDEWCLPATIREVVMATTCVFAHTSARKPRYFLVVNVIIGSHVLRSFRRKRIKCKKPICLMHLSDSACLAPDLDLGLPFKCLFEVKRINNFSVKHCVCVNPNRYYKFAFSLRACGRKIIVI